MELYETSALLSVSSKTFKNELEKMDSKKIIEYQKYLWNKVMKAGIAFKSSFSRQDITNNLESTTNYMYRMGCTYPKSYCKAKICILTNPNCAKQKIIETSLALKEMYIILKTEKNGKNIINIQESKDHSNKNIRSYI